MTDADQKRLEEAVRRTNTDHDFGRRARMAESLYDRYMKADAARRAHGETCTKCSPDARCDTGQRLCESFSRLQDAYLAQQKERRG